LDEKIKVSKNKGEEAIEAASNPHNLLISVSLQGLFKYSKTSFLVQIKFITVDSNS
jgi:hypothetical protein